MRQISGLFLLGLILLFMPICCQKRPAGFKICRLIDSFEKNNIRESPFLHLAEGVDNSRDRFPAKSSPLQEMGTGANPYLLKRKIKVGREYLNALFAPPESRYDFTLRAADSLILEFGVGIIQDANSRQEHAVQNDSPKEVRFVVLIEASGEEKVIYEERLVISVREGRQVFLLRSLDLSSYGGKVRLSLLTKGREGAFSFWYNPVLYPKGGSRRQVILISIDTLRADHLGCYGYERPTSPNIDALAEESALFVNSYASSPWTLPSHVSMLTALNTVRHGVYSEDQRMSPDSTTLAELLRMHGFFCSAFTGGGFVSSAFGFADGFDSYFERTDEVVLDHAAELCFRDVARWIEQNKDRDFFLFIHTYQPHDPYMSPLPYKTRFLSDQASWSHLNLMGYLGGKSGIFKPLSAEERQNIVDLYDSEILYTDAKLVGPLIAKLKELSLYKQAMIVFTSDHGEEFFEHGGWGHGHSLYDESLRIPLVIKFPEEKFKGQKMENIVSLVDIVPTVLDEFGIGWAKSRFDGRSLVPVLKGSEKDHRTFLADVGENVLNLHLPQKTATNEGAFKFILNKKLSTEELNFFQYPPPPVQALQLFDLNADPLERINIVDDKALLARRFLGQIESIYAQAGVQRREAAVLDEELTRQLRALGYVK